MGGTASRTAWWLYFGLLALHVATAPLLERLDPIGWASLVLSGAGLLGLWGYLRKRAIGRRPVWIVYLVALLLSIAHDMTVSFLTLMSGWSVAWVVEIAIGLAFNFPLLWASWRYAFCSPEIWRRTRHRG